MEKYRIILDNSEQKTLKDIVQKGKSAAYKIKHANILLSADENGSNLSDAEISKLFHCHKNTVRNVRLRYIEGGLDYALERNKRELPPVSKILDGEKEAKLIALCCSNPPEGRARWTLELLADKLIEMKVVDSISWKTVSRTLKKMNLNLI